MARILAVDDERAILDALARVLGRDGHEVVRAADPTAVPGMDLSRFDLVLCDVMMPGLDGFELVRQIRPDFDGPIVFLTARVAEEDAVAAYGLGADDYVRNKPFGAAELRAKVAAHLRRERRPRSHALSFGEVRIDLGARALAVGGEAVPLTPTEYAICEYLARHPGQVSEPARRSARRCSAGERRRRRGHIHAGQPRPEETSEAGADPIATVWGWGTGGSSEDRGARSGMLSFVIARYFAYAFAAVATAWLASFMVLSAAINAGFVYEASWGPANAREVAEGLARDGVCEQQDVPTAYRYLILNKDGYVLMTDLEGTRLEDATEMARTALAADPGTVEIEGGGSGLTYAVFSLKGGGACALVSEYLPQWVSRDLASLLPNPQNLMLAGAAAGSALALALVARRASHVISRKMAPLAEAAERVGAGELDFAVGSTNVREVNDVLAAMDAMRTSLAESLEARWAAERGQREQVASLAHDLKTPLTVLRANADFVAEELEDEKDADLAAAARDIAGSVERLDGYVRLLIDASRGSDGAERAPMRPAELCKQVLAEAAQIARARGVTLDAATPARCRRRAGAPLDRTALAREPPRTSWPTPPSTRARARGGPCDVAGGHLVIEVAETDRASLLPPSNAAASASSFTDDSSPAPHATETATTARPPRPPPRPRAPRGLRLAHQQPPRVRWPSPGSLWGPDSGPHTGIPHNQNASG